LNTAILRQSLQGRQQASWQDFDTVRASGETRES